MKSLMSLWSSIANDLAIRCCTSAAPDVNYVSRRVQHEGLSFLAITLANYGKAFERWLDHGMVAPSDAVGFSRTPGRRRNGLPEFLRGFLERVFDPCSGALLDEPDIEAIFAIRQLTLMFSKIALPADPREGDQHRLRRRHVVSSKRESEAMSNYIKCEQEVKASDAARTPREIEEFKIVFDMLFGDMCKVLDQKVFDRDLFPRHGPGATSDRLSSNGKFDQKTWPARLHRIFPFEEFAVPNSSFAVNGREAVYRVTGYTNPHHAVEVSELEEIDILEPDAEIPVRVITVPKTLKAPRIIAIEPAAMQYMQQALDREIREFVRRDSFLRRVIGFDDQEPNRQMAFEGSLRGDLATLDLSDASDRVSLKLVQAAFSDYPLLLEAIEATRSWKAQVPGHGVIHLSKFASMGSALCFPIEAMVFLTMIFVGIFRESSAPLCRDTLEAYRGRVRVFGDDIIVPVDSVHTVIRSLETYGSKVNSSKSFWTGRFRESCGREYFRGHDVSIVRVRDMLPTSRQHANGVISAVKLRNLLYKAGVWGGARYLDSYLGKLLQHFPNVGPESPLLGRESFLGYETQGMDPNLHSPLAKGYYVKAKAPRDVLEGPGALHKCLAMLESRARSEVMERPLSHLAGSPPGVSEHLERTGRPERVNIKLGMRQPF